MRLSNLADKSCQVLEEAMQFPSDLYLTQLVRIQQTADTIRATLYNDLLEPEPNMSAMVSMAMSSLETEVEKIEITLSREIPQGRESFYFPYVGPCQRVYVNKEQRC